MKNLNSSKQGFKKGELVVIAEVRGKTVKEASEVVVRNRLSAYEMLYGRKTEVAIIGSCTGAILRFTEYQLHNFHQAVDYVDVTPIGCDNMKKPACFHKESWKRR